MKTVIQIIEYGSGNVVHEVEVTGMTERQIGKIEQGMNINLNHSSFYTNEAEIEDRELITSH